jgi:precorrin-6Y C5,15-methyltransferase (decarboxylating)
MYKVCVFAGTTEGRELIRFLCAQGVKVTACVATEYGETLLEEGENLTVSAKRLEKAEMAELIRREGFNLVVDATHPYASVVTENIAAACREAGAEYLRLLRPESGAEAGAVYVPDVPAAAEYLAGTQGNILLTTGSKELGKFAGIPDFADRVYARVLPMPASLDSCAAAGLPPAHILAMQGPFSKDLNVALLKTVSAEWLVTKDGGNAGGFAEKAEAAREAGARLLVIGRPPQRAGLGLEDMTDLLCEKLGLSPLPQVSLVGIGPGSAGSMTGDARRAIREADCLIGAARMLEAGEPGKATYAAIAPGPIAEYILSHREFRRFAVLLSGDVGFFSGARKLLPLLKDKCRLEVLPGLSSLVTLCARLGTDYEDVTPLSLHGRSGDIVSALRDHRRIFALVGGENGMGALCRTLADAGLGEVRVSVGEKLSYPDEKITVGTAAELQSRVFESLSVALIEADLPGRLVTPGLPDGEFLRGGGEDGVVPMTKSEVRAVSLSKLRLREDSLCWDVGAGTGSVAVEMALLARRGRVWAIEKRSDAMDLLRQNKEKFRLENLELVEGPAPEACRDLPAPTHVFIGGSSGNIRDILALAREKNPEVRVVATAIALESVGELTACMKDKTLGEAEVCCLQVSRGRKAGPYHLMLGQNPVYIFTLQGGGKA